jgi:parallel beta-helix repeat protein
MASSLIVTSILAPLLLVVPSPDASKDILERILTLNPHYPIVIRGDLEFADKALSEGWSGTGIEGDPYVISELDIVGNNTVYCISISDTSVHFVIRNCSLREGYGSEIRLENTANATIENNTMTDGTFYAIYGENCRNVTIANNSVFGGTHGIGLGWLSRDIVLRGNVVTDSSWWGTVFWSWCSNVTLRDNEYYGSGIQVHGGSNSFDIDTSNTVDGSPIYYISDTDGGTVPTGAGQVILVNCTNMTVESQGWGGICRQIALQDCHGCTISGNNITTAYEGILLISSPSNTIDNNTIVGGHEGIRMDADSYCRVENNSISDCINYGIQVQGSDFVTIADNHFANCSQGIYLNSVTYSWVSRNWVDNCTGSSGLFLLDSAYETITNNAFVDNSQYGIRALWNDYTSLIVNNSFIRNCGTGEVWTGQSQAYDDSGLIDWSQGSYGNYWFDWQSPDDDGDGIVDLPYIISGGAGAYDPYPLAMAPPMGDFTPPTADAGSDQTVDEDTLVIFDGSDSSDNVNIDNYTWIFTDGTAKTLYGVSPTYTFETPGTYTVTLNVTDAASNSGTDEVTITVNDATIPSANAGPDQNVAEDTIVTLDGSGSTDNVGIANYSWSLIETIDGNEVETYLMGEHSTIVFENPGEYIITLMVLDFTGLWDTDDVTIMVADTTPPTADAGLDQTVDEDAPVTFEGNGSIDNVGIVNYTWTFTYEGHTIELYGETPTFVFERAGVYTVTLTVEDAVGRTSTDVVEITVEKKAGISMLAVGAIGLVIVAIVALALFMMIRKKKPPHET